MSTTIFPTITHGAPVAEYDGASTTFTSDKYKGDGYSGFVDGLHTVATYLSAFEGTVTIQATLHTDPTETDWADISTVATGDNITPATDNYVNNVTGNFVWIRIKITDFVAGTIRTIQYNY